MNFIREMLFMNKSYTCIVNIKIVKILKEKHFLTLCWFNRSRQLRTIQLFVCSPAVGGERELEG